VGSGPVLKSGARGSLVEVIEVVAGPEVRALCVPYRAVTHGLSRLVTVSRNCCSSALS
jgi:hypothetical protein